MPKPRSRHNNNQPLTTTQQLGSLMKSARDIMRKDKGLNGDLDRLPMLTWIMFLKFLDDMEQLRRQEAELEGVRFKPALEKPYRWRDWAAQDDGITGPELIAFINQDEAKRPDGKRGPGLFAYLRNLQSPDGKGRQEVIANVFRGVFNRMESGYLLRDVINKVNGIHFNSSEEIHTLSHLYESMLREMRDAAGDSGEFYTPRAVIQFMVTVTAPQLGEAILDPACGTGGFLVEAYSQLEKQCKTVQDRRTLQRASIFGQEAKPLPYMLAQMNLLLHGLESPRIDYGNSLSLKVTEIGDKDRVDIILTNPPFGGEEEGSIKNNFPADMQTAETALRMGNIQDGTLDTRDLKYLHIAEKDREKWILRHQNIIVNRTNSAELVGKCAVFNLEGDWGFASYLIRLRLDLKRADAKLVTRYINSPIGREYMFRERKQMTGQANVNSQKLNSLPISLPPIDEQRRIVAYLDGLQAQVDRLKALQAQTAAELEALLPSILAQAFKGEL